MGWRKKQPTLPEAVSGWDLVKEEEGWQIRDRKQHKIHHYNAQGLLMAVEDQNGQCIRLTYDNGRLQRITTPFGYELDVKLPGRTADSAEGQHGKNHAVPL